MNKDDLEKIENIDINLNRIKYVKEEYKVTSLPDIVQHILSSGKQSKFLSEGRIVSDTEVDDSYDFIHVNFPKLRLIPLIDVGDNDYIVYDISHDSYSMFNIVENISFGAKKRLEDYVR